MFSSFGGPLRSRLSCVVGLDPHIIVGTVGDGRLADKGVRVRVVKVPVVERVTAGVVRHPSMIACGVQELVPDPELPSPPPF